jgi:uncharacterized membrane protein YcfT
VRATNTNAQKLAWPLWAAAPGDYMDKPRVDWVDYAKGLCMFLVVMFHCITSYDVLTGYERGFLHEVMDFALPFRMPDFFLISGLFLSRTINSPLRDFIDRKVVHFIYFYVLWLVIQMGIVEANILVADPLEWVRQYFFNFIVPYQTLWFVHMLAIFFAFTRLVRRVPPWIILAIMATLQALYHAEILVTNWSVADRFFDRYIYFYIGFVAAPYVFKFADFMWAHWRFALLALLIWGVANYWGVRFFLHFQPITSLIMGVVGAGAIITTSAVFSRLRIGEYFRYMGQHSIVVYLSFFFPMKVMHKILLAWNIIPEKGWADLATTIIAATAPLVFHYYIKNTPLNFLYARPKRFRIVSAKSGAQAAGI